MNFLYVSCNYPAVNTYFCQRLARAGATVLGLGDIPEGSLPAYLADSLRAYRHIPDMNDLAAMKAAARELRDRFGSISRIDSNIEHWLPTEAALRSLLNVPGMQPEYLTYARSKIGMKKLFADAGVPLMAGIATNDKERLREFTQFHGFPIFFKPDTGVGAAGTFRVDSADDFEKRLDSIPPNYIAEPYLRGRIVTFDGLADKNCDVFYCTSHIYNPVADIIAEARDCHIYSLRTLPETLERLGRASVKAFEIRERFFHIEFFETAPEEYIALEMNLRAPGSTLLHLMNYAADIDIFDIYAKMAVRGETNLHYDRKYHTAHVGRRNSLTYKHPHDSVLARLGPALVNHAPSPPEDRSALGDHYYIIRHESFVELSALIAYIEEKA
jgi:hypothetical protein